MARYIDGEPLLAEKYEGFDRANETDWQKGYWAGIDEMCEKIKAQPTADVVEVVHGEWESYPSTRYRRCSVCKTEFYKEWFRYKGKYCPNCGAKMDGKKAE